MRRTLSVLTLRFALIFGWSALVVVPMQCQPSPESVLYSFTGGTDGAEPFTPVILDAQNNLYGTTNQSNLGPGVLFKVTPSGEETVLHTFCFERCTDGDEPSGLIFGPTNDLYGTTIGGGYYGGGILFQLASDDVETVLNSFGALPPSIAPKRLRVRDGAEPAGGVVFDAQGNFYGVTSSGGIYNNGTVFEVTSSGAETILYNFAGGADGTNPSGPLIFDAQGSLYGTTFWGGLYDEGTLFKLTPDGTKTTLYSFCSQPGCTDGAHPNGGLAIDGKGNLFGTTYEGGASCNDDEYTCGLLFEFTVSGSEIVLHSFVGLEDGAYPNGGLIFDGQGNLYGTTYMGGVGYSCDEGCGTVFEVTPSGAETALYSFNGRYRDDGAFPLAGVAMDAHGNIYGTTEVGGVYDWGTVFKLTH